MKGVFLMSNPDAQMRILKMIEDGKISAEEGVRLMEALKDDESGGRRRHGRKNFEFDWAFDAAVWEQIGKKIEKELSKVEKSFRENLWDDDEENEKTNDPPQKED